MAARDLPVSPTRSARALYNRFKHAGRLTTEPQPGDLVFWWRNSPNSWTGHVGFIRTVTDTEIVTIEGNVNNRVVERRYPRHNISRLLGFGSMSR